MAGSARKGAFAGESKVSESEVALVKRYCFLWALNAKNASSLARYRERDFVIWFFYALEIVNANSIAVDWGGILWPLKEYAWLC